MKVNLAEKLAMFSSHWDPHVIADYNDNEVMVVKFRGEFPFHSHPDTDDFFLVLDGEMVMEFEDPGRAAQTVAAGEVIVVPKGVVHRPRADHECKVLLIEPRGLPNTGNLETAAPKTRI